MNLFQFFELLGTKEKSISYVLEKKVIYQEFRCLECSLKAKFCANNAGNMYFRCSNSNCKRPKVSVWYGTIFMNAKISIEKIMMIIYLWLHKTKTMQIVEMSGLSYKTVERYISKIERIIASDIDEEDEIIGGEGIEVQIDESKFGKRKYHRGHQVDGVWILGGVELTPERKLFLRIVQDRTRNTLQPIIERHVRPGSIIITDCWKPYQRLSELDYSHYTVNHSEGFKDPLTGVHTNNIEGTWSGIKGCASSWHKTQWGIKGKLIEFTWRRKNASGLWEAIINAMKEVHLEENDD